MAPGHGDSSETLLAYLHVLRRWKWVVLLAVLIVPAIALVFSLRQEKLYRASAEVLLSQQDLGAALTGIPNLTASQDASRQSQTQADLARVPEVARRVVEAVDGAPSAGALLGDSAVRPKQNSNLLVFTVTNRDPALAARLATAYANEFTIYRRELDTRALKAARAELQERIKSVAPRSGQEPSQLYQSLIEKEQQLATLDALQGANASLIQAADGASQLQPHPVRNAFLAGVLGIFVGIGLAFVFEALDRRVRSADEIERSLRTPLLAWLATPPRRLQGPGAPAMIVEPDGPQAEAFRSLRTNLELMGVGREIRTLMVTSAIAGEGKSTTVANLAVAFARAGRRTILVDLDLRRPTVEAHFGIPRRPGVTEAVHNSKLLDKAIVPVPVLGPELKSRNGREPRSVEYASLRLLPVGAIPPNPGEFIAGEGVSKLLLDLQERADVVLIDTPPLLTVGDTVALSSRVDAMLVVANLTRIRRPLLRELARVLNQSGSRLLGFAVAGVGTEHSYYGYDSAYYHGVDRAASGREGSAEEARQQVERPSFGGRRR